MRKLRSYQFHILNELKFNESGDKVALCDNEYYVSQEFHYQSVSHAFHTRLSLSSYMICPSCLKVVKKVFNQ